MVRRVVVRLLAKRLAQAARRRRSVVRLLLLLILAQLRVKQRPSVASQLQAGAEAVVEVRARLRRWAVRQLPAIEAVVPLLA